MSFSSRSSSRHNISSNKIQKSANQKKAALKRAKTGAKYLNAKSDEQTLQDIIEKTLASIERLGNQVFALSPFSQYYDDWLINLRQVVSEFEAFSGMISDEVFVKECEQMFLDIELSLSEHRVQEEAVAEAEKALYGLSQELRGVEVNYTEESQVLNNKRNADTQQLTNKIRVIEEDKVNHEELKFGVFQFGAKKEAAKKLEQIQQSLIATKKQLETISQNFTVEHNQLHENYVAKKQELTVKSDTLRKTIEQLEIDTSIESRKKICISLNNTINELIKRLPTSTTTDPSN